MVTLRGDKRYTADFLLSVVFWVALAVLIVNDFVIKQVSPGVVSGKLSDIAGPIVAALVLVAGTEIIVRWLQGDTWARPSWFIGSACLVVATFAVVKLTPVGADIYAESTRQILSVAQWVLSPLGASISPDVPVVVRDPLDVVVALVAIPIAALVGWRWRQPLGRSDS